MSSLQQLRGPIAAEKPCGDDLSYDPVFLDLQTKIRGREETQFAAAEEPDWKEILELALGLAARGKHLQVGVILSAALLQTQGLPGFCEGLQLLSVWLENYWEPLYPRLDPDDQNDPTERVNLLQALSVTAEGDPLRFCERLAHLPLSESPTLGRLDLAQIETGQEASAAESKTGASPAQVAAALRDTPPEWLQKRRDAAHGALAALRQMEALLGKYIGGGRAPNWEALKNKLTAIRSVLGQSASTNAAEAPSTVGSAPAPVGAPANREAAPRVAAPGGIESRADVLAALDAVREYYKRREPSSPVPFLIQRAQRLVPLDFLQIMGDLAPDSLAQIKTVTGATDAPPEKSV
jgi:type VI secretion system protein ImpA